MTPELIASIILFYLIFGLVVGVSTQNTGNKVLFVSLLFPIAILVSVYKGAKEYINDL